jgi:alanine racemase
MMKTPDHFPRAVLQIDLAAYRANLRRLSELVDGTPIMAVVKADGYGHGMLPVARAARQAGVPWLGVATLDEALQVRADGDSGRLLAWLVVPGEDYRPALRADVDVAAYTRAGLEEIAAAAREVGVVARVHLKVDSGLNRGGATAAEWPDLVALARELERDRAVSVVGVWSHFACSDEPDHPSNVMQEGVFADALLVAERAGLTPEVRHLANSAGALTRPGARYDLVRIGLAGYGLSPIHGLRSPADLALTPIMTARTHLAMVKQIEPGASVSYGHTWTADRATTLGLVPVGYGEGIPRHGSSRIEIGIDGVRRRAVGRICMDQFVIDLEDSQAHAGDALVLFGDGHDGLPTAEDWAVACGTISYEIVTRIGGRFTREYVDEATS